MPLLLQRAEGTIRVPERIWEVLLSMAHQRDWKPFGPDLPGKRHIEDPERYEEVDWRNDYYTPEGQFITEEDALAIAHALEQFLPDIPDDDATEEDIDEHTHLAELPVSPYELFRGEGKQLVRDFINFCAKGGFYVHGGSTLGA